MSILIVLLMKIVGPDLLLLHVLVVEILFNYLNLNKLNVHIFLLLIIYSVFYLLLEFLWSSNGAVIVGVALIDTVESIPAFFYS